MRYKQRLLALSIALSVFFGSGAYIWTLKDHLFAYELPKDKVVFAELKPPSTLAIKDRFSKVLHYLPTDKLRIYKSLSEISENLRVYVTMLEDDKFFTHNGFDMAEIKNSIEKNLAKGSVKRGASTITQQLAKNLFLDKERSWKRKLFEVPWTIRLERDLSKNQILELYLNVIEWGPGIYGAEAAARHFFDRSASDLDPGQAMYLALIIPNPVRFDALANPKTLDFLEKKKRALVTRLVDEKKILIEDKQKYLNEEFNLTPPAINSRHFALAHNASYAGNRKSLQKNHYRTFLEKNWSTIRKSKKGSEIESTLDAQLLDELERWPLSDQEEVTKDRFWIIKEDSLVRAFKFLPKNKKIDSSALSGEHCAAPYSCEESDSVDWKSLAP